MPSLIGGALPLQCLAVFHGLVRQAFLLGPHVAISRSQAKCHMKGSHARWAICERGPGWVLSSRWFEQGLPW
eukprot:4201275-Amphidinium_carterae.1